MGHIQHLPCLHCHPHRFIRMVHCLIESCLLLHMSMDQCIKALSLHASIEPLVTITVWKELMRENRGFFRAYEYLPNANYKQIKKASRFGKRFHWK